MFNNHSAGTLMITAGTSSTIFTVAEVADSLHEGRGLKLQVEAFRCMYLFFPVKIENQGLTFCPSPQGEFL